MRNTNLVSPLHNFEFEINSFNLIDGWRTYVELKHKQLPISFACAHYSKNEPTIDIKQNLTKELYSNFIQCVLHGKVQSYNRQDTWEVCYCPEYDKVNNAWFILKNGEYIYETFE